MRLRRLDLLRYGHFTDRSFELHAGNIDFHIVFGPNEAGKSTALSAIEDLLFGIPLRSPYDFKHDYSSMRIGAVIENGTESMEFVRRKGSKDTLLGDGDLPIPGGEAVLRPFLARADRSSFERMFSLDHVRLETGGKEILEARDEIGQMLFAAGTGISGLRERLASLTGEANELWAPRRAKDRKYYVAADKLKAAESELRQHTLTASKWQELKRTFDNAEKAYAEVEAEFEKATAERRRLGRIRRVYRHVGRKAELDREIAALGTVASLPEDARKVLDESERKESDASTRIDVLSGGLAKAREELKALTYDEPLVLRADDIDHLHERRIEIRGERADLPKRQAELDAAEAGLRALAAELGWDEKEVDASIARIPGRTKLAAVRPLLARRGELASDIRNRTESLEEAEAERAGLQTQLEAMGETTDVTGLEAVIKMVRERGDIGHRLRVAQQQVEDAQERVDRLLSLLHPGLQGEKDAARMQAPPRTEVREHRDRVQDWERRTRDCAQRFAAAQRELEQTRRILGNAVRDEHAISIEDLQEARNERDALWKLVQQKHIENVPISDDDANRYADVLDDLASAFEPAIHAADEIADRRFDNAESAGRLSEMSRNIGEQEDNLAQLRQQQEAFIQEGGRLDAEWRAQWAGAPFAPLSPDTMLEWLDAREKLLEAIERRSEATGEMKIQQREALEATEGLLAELSSLNVDTATLANDALSEILERAEGVRRQYGQQAEARAQLGSSLQEAAANRVRHRRELDRAEKAWSEWKEEWSAALTELGLTTGSNPEAVSAQIDVIDQMREMSGRINALRHERIDKINRDIADFESVVDTIVGPLAADLAGTSADDAVVEIEKRLEKAQRMRDLQAREKEEIAKIENEVNTLVEDRRKARDSVNHLKDTAGAGTSDELRNAIQNSDRLRDLQDELATTLQTLDEEGDGLATAALEAECQGIDIDRIAAREETAEGELKTLRDRLTEAAGVRTQARDAFQAVGGGDAAARAEATRQEAISEIREVSERYVRVRTSATLLQWAIDRYRREKQAPLLKRSGRFFRTITRGSFKDLWVDYDDNDQAQLTGLRPDGTVVPVAGMSSGTADQLYLALRIASIEDYLERADILPFVADDLFVNFDDDRAGAGFEVLGELSRKTQVLFFTHHSHLLDIARKTLGSSISVINLN